MGVFVPQLFLISKQRKPKYQQIGDCLCSVVSIHWHTLEMVIEICYRSVSINIKQESFSYSVLPRCDLKSDFVLLELRHVLCFK